LLISDQQVTEAFSTLLRRPGLWASNGGVLATQRERKMLASACLYSLYAWFTSCSTRHGRLTYTRRWSSTPGHYCHVAAMGRRLRTDKPPRPTQPPTLRSTGNEYRPKCGDSLQLGRKGRYGSFHLWITCGW